MSDIITFEADKVKVTGPKVDGGFSITFEAGEYMQATIAKLLLIPQQTTIKVTIEPEN